MFRFHGGTYCTSHHIVLKRQQKCRFLRGAYYAMHRITLLLKGIVEICSQDFFIAPVKRSTNSKNSA